MWCDLGFFPNSRGNKAVVNLRDESSESDVPLGTEIVQVNLELLLCSISNYIQNYAKIRKA